MLPVSLLTFSSRFFFPALEPSPVLQSGPGTTFYFLRLFFDPFFLPTDFLFMTSPPLFDERSSFFFERFLPPLLFGIYFRSSSPKLRLLAFGCAVNPFVIISPLS